MISKILSLLWVLIAIGFLNRCGSTTSSTDLTFKGGGGTLQASNPLQLKVKVYSIYLSTSEFCTSPKQVFNDTSPSYKNVLDHPTLGSASNADGSWNGTYKCIIIKMSDVIKFTPATTDGTCQANTEYTLDVCGSGYSTKDINGNSSNCDSTDNTPYLYLSTASTSEGGTVDDKPWVPPVSGTLTNGFKLQNAFVVSGAKTGTFNVDGSGKVDGSSSQGCDMQPPSFSFKE